jgi:hypothetical protein
MIQPLLPVCAALYDRDRNAKERHMDDQSTPAELPPPNLPPAAQRALAEAEARRAAAAPLDLPPELGGRKGPEPVRYGDWEKKGLAIDF